MSVKNSNEPTVTTTTNEPGTPAPSPSTDVFEEWNIQDERVSGSHTVLDGKIIARMPDLGAAPVTAVGVTVKQSAADEEPGAAELFYRAFAVALRGKRSKSTPSESNKNLFRRVSAVGIVVLIIGTGILFLDKNASDKDVLPETAVSEKSNDGVVGDGYPVVVPPYSVHSVAPHSGTAEQQAALQPPSDVPAAGTNAPNHPAKNPWERTGNPVDGVTAAAASAVSAAGVEMYPIPSQDNTAMNNPAVQGANVDNSFAQQNYPPSYQPSYPPNAGQTPIAAYPAPNQQGNYTGATVAAAGYSQTSAAVPNDYNVPEQTPYQPQPNVNYPNPNGNPNYQPGSYLQSAGRAVPSPYHPAISNPAAQYQANPYPQNQYPANQYNTNSNMPIPESAAYPPPQAQVPAYYQQTPAPYPQGQYQQAPQVSQPNYPHDYVPSHRKVY